jgi:hypothetical protein
MDMKKCSRCNVEKELSEFMKCSAKKDGIGPWCNECSREHARINHLKNKELNNQKAREWKKNNPEKNKAYMDKWRSDNDEHAKAYSKSYGIANKDKIKAYAERTKEHRAERAKIYRQKNKERDKATRDAWIKANPEKRREAAKRWRAANPEKSRELIKRGNKKRGEQIKYRISGSVSRRIRTSLFDNGSKASRHWESLVDFTLDQLRSHLQKLFKPGMTWENYGTVWEIDHKIPLAAFNFDKPDQIDFKLCWSLKNLQPLGKFENKSKGAKLERHFQPSLKLSVG